MRLVLCSLLSLASLVAVNPGRAQRPADSAVSATIAAKKPVFAGACKACPWGILAKVTADALAYYGYQTTICWVCWSSFGPREMADKTRPVMPPGAELSNAEYIEPPPGTKKTARTPCAATPLKSSASADLKGSRSFHSGCCAATALTRSTAK